MRAVIWTTVLMVMTLTVGCGADKPAGPSPEEIAAEKVQQAMAAGAQEDAGPVEMVEVAAEGTEFEPPVQIEQLPAGVWFCDMGTVHYARTEKGDGRCPVCGMNLSHKASRE